MRVPVLTAAASLACAAAAMASDTLPAYRARMYARPAAQTWQAVRDTLAELKLKPETMDATAQTVVTRPAGYGSGTLKGPELPGYDPLRFQLHVYVSPYTEPARVHVGSLSELRKRAGGTSTLYNGGVVEEWFLGALERRLGLQGHAIPVDRGQRDALARELAGVEPCQPAEDPSRKSIEAPRKIKASVVELIYPARASREAIGGAVVLELTVGEDGAIYAMRVVRMPQDDLQFKESALGATSLVRYVPARFMGCRVPTVMTYTVNYRLR